MAEPLSPNPQPGKQDKKLPASNYGFPNHEDGIQSGDTSRDEAKAYAEKPHSPPDGLAGR